MFEDLLRHKFDNLFFACLDFETEGLSLYHARPWSVAWNLYKGQQLLESHSYFLKWSDLKVSADAARVTGFNPQLVDKEGKDPREILSLFEKYLYNPEIHLVGANLLGYDVYVHNTWRRSLGLNGDYSYISRVYDTVALSRGLKMNLKPEKGIGWQYKLINTKFKGVSNSAMAKHFNIKVDELKLHGADYDVILSWEVFKNLVWKMEI